ncbi:alpha/beta hydrolase [Halomonas huangheensis]|uniref:alpha/beta hydrolase n=1 Tax=Halomonas huangheensis TaxID=1178482 RepID=UPI0009DBF41C|nr:alpha/beta hydrolase [Halomonas huangheensis]
MLRSYSTAPNQMNYRQRALTQHPMLENFVITKSCIGPHDRAIRYRVYTRKTSNPTLLAIHGARSNLESLDHLLHNLLTQRNIHSASFDLSGHHTDQNLMGEQSSLHRNLSEAQHLAGIFKPNINTLLGYSLGGAIALKLAERHRHTFEKLILVCPAIYSEEAYSRPFGKEFKTAITQPYSFLNSSSYEFLRSFTGRVLLIIGEHDGLRAMDYEKCEGSSVGLISSCDGSALYSPIPAEVIEGIESATNAKLKKLIIPGCDHHILSKLRSDLSAKELVTNCISDFLT